MPLTRKDVEHVATLARLDLAEEEKDLLLRQLGDILGYVEKLGRLRTDDVPPTSHVLPIVNVFRADEVVPSFPPEDIMSGAPAREKGHYRVPKIIDAGE